MEYFKTPFDKFSLRVQDRLGYSNDYKVLLPKHKLTLCISEGSKAYLPKKESRRTRQARIYTTLSQYVGKEYKLIYFVVAMGSGHL